MKLDFKIDTEEIIRFADKACLDLRPQSSVVRDGEGREKQCEQECDPQHVP